MSGYFKRRRLRRGLRDLLHHARHLRNMREDFWSDQERAGMAEAIEGAAVALRRRDAREFLGAAEALEARVLALSPRRTMPGVRDNFETIVVALGVAMAFRAYFFQPFKIPTGSMQPTLYGIHSVEREAGGAWDRLPLKPVRWIVTGAWHRTVVARADGDLVRIRGESRRPGYAEYQVAGRRHFVPADAVGDGDAHDGMRVLQGERVRRGQVLWAGDVISGDHVFVNRMTWNFRPPRRDDVMVFATDGVEDLPPGTHYIKRLVALSEEIVSIDPPRLMIDNRVVDTSKAPGIRRVMNRERLAEWAEPYDGYRTIEHVPSTLRYPSPLRRPTDRITLGKYEFFGMGDNTRNSYDCRYFGPVPGENLVGPAVFAYWPFTSPRWGRLR